MIVERLVLKNFMRYRNPCRLDFTHKKTVGIVGANESGKSTILQAISYALYGKTRAARELQLIHDQGRRDLVVQLGVRFPDGSTLEIERGRTRTNTPILAVAGLRGKVTDIAEYIQEKIRLCYDDFIALSYFVQGDIHQFMQGNKRVFFQRWAEKLQIWAGYEQAAVREIRDIENERARLNTETAQVADLIANALIIRASEVCARYRVRLAEDQVYQCERDVQRAQQMQHGVTRAGSSVDQVHQTIAPIMAELRDKLQRIEMDISTVKREMQQTATGQCPVLSIHCGALKRHGDRERATKQGTLTHLESVKQAISQRIKATAAQYEQAKAQAKAVYSQHVATVDQAVQQATQALRKANYQLQSAIRHHGTKQDSVRQLNHALRGYREKQDRLRVLEKNLSTLRFIRYMVGKGGVPSSVMNHELQQVESRCNFVLERLGYAKRVQFRGYKELASYEAVCPVCGTDQWSDKCCVTCGCERRKKRRDEPIVIVKDRCVDRPFELESGGAQVIQSFAVRLAVSLFVSNLTHTPMQLILLDEIFGMLDASNRQRLMSLVMDRLSSEFGVEQQFVVSHQEDVISSVDHLLYVTANADGSSAAQWG